MTREAAIATGCLIVAFITTLGALRCLADRLLPSAAIYTVIALAVFAGGVRAVLF